MGIEWCTPLFVLYYEFPSPCLILSHVFLFFFFLCMFVHLFWVGVNATETHKVMGIYMMERVWWKWGCKFNYYFQGKVFSDSESIQARAEAVMLLKKLDFPVCVYSFCLLITYSNAQSVLHCNIQVNKIECLPFLGISLFLCVLFCSHVKKSILTSCVPLLIMLTILCWLFFLFCWIGWEFEG